MRKMRTGVWALRRTDVDKVSRGLLWGFVVPGPLAAFCYAYLFFAYPPGCVSILKTIHPERPHAIDVAVSTPELAVALAPVISADAILIVGSSEMAIETDPAGKAGTRERDPDRSSLHDHLMFNLNENGNESTGATSPQSATKRFVTIIPRGSAVFRTALLLERLRRHIRASPTPMRIVVLDNSHYATAGSQHWPDLRTEFPDDASLLTHFQRRPDSPLGRIPLYQTQIQRAGLRTKTSRPYATLLPGEIAVFRAFLGRTILARARRSLLQTSPSPERLEFQTSPTMNDRKNNRTIKRTQARRDAVWGVDERFVPAAGAVAELRVRKNSPERFAGTVYGRSVENLARARRWLPDGSRIEFVLLPLHFRYYGALGLDGRALERRRRDFVRDYFPEAVYAEWMANPALHFDSIHYTDAGRARLAAELRRRFH